MAPGQELHFLGCVPRNHSLTPEDLLGKRTNLGTRCLSRGGRVQSLDSRVETVSSKRGEGQAAGQRH